jgi:YHS domain-containing protein
MTLRAVAIVAARPERDSLLRRTTMTTLVLQRLFFALTTAGLMLGALAINATADEVNKGVYGDIAILTGFSGDVAIRGYDPVAYFTDKRAVLGSEAYSYKWLGATWRFASDEHRRLFTNSPISYAPQYGGLCAESVSYYGRTVVNIDPESWQIIDGKLYLSGDAHFQDRTLDVAAADLYWPKARAKIEK